LTDINQAEEILKKIKIDNYTYLGKGDEGIVFHDNLYVYKVFINNTLDKKSSDFLKKLISKPLISNFFINLLDLVLVDDIYVLKYSYYNNYKKVQAINKEEAVNFAIDCWKNKVICKNIKLENFIKIGNSLKFIDYGTYIVLYNDNLFLNMCARLYIEIMYNNLNEDEKKELKQKTINNFIELEGIQNFINNIFSKIILSYSPNKIINNIDTLIDIKNNNNLIDLIINSKTEKYLFKNFNDLNFSKLHYALISKGIKLINIDYYNLKLTEEHISLPKPEYYFIEVTRNRKQYDVSLMIKTCIQESNTIYNQVKHIINQLSTPNSFKDVIVVIDTKKDDFLREYNTSGKYKELLNEVQKLIDEELINYIIELPNDKILKTNKKWFDIDKCNETHTINNTPVTTQLYAFENIKSKYILQLDSDVLIGRKDFSHSFLSDMIKELENNKKVVSVGFNIPKLSDEFNNYYGFDNGGFVPEVRFALIEKERLLSLRPLPNNLIGKKLELTWYRSLHQKQKLINKVSIRGGNPKSYFIHPQNFRKECIDVWFTILDRIENGYLIQKQKEEYELVGSFYDWSVPKRSEELVIITLVKDMSYEGFLRCWNSIINQKDTNFGWIIIDDNSSNGLNTFIKFLIKNSKIKEKITYIQNRFQQYGMANTYKAIHYFCDDPNSIICMIDGDDALIGDNVISNTKKLYQKGADVVIGKMYRTDKLYPKYRYIPNFKKPRINGGNVWQHFKTFRKYLFDSIKLWDFKIENQNKILGKTKEWIKYSVDYAIMIPIVEMSKTPTFHDEYNYLHQRRLPSNKKMKDIKNKYISKIITNSNYTPNSVMKNNRRDFIPNENNIEIDILYKCNLKCESCNRSSAQVDSEDYISIKQINKFISESIKLNKKWNLINILGGEPTLHPEFLKIIDLILYKYIDIYSKSTILQITSNGYSTNTKNILSRLPNHYNLHIDKKSFKISNKIDYFTPFNNAPIDQIKYKNSHNFSSGCWVTSYCGINLNKNGYYPCSIIGSIDRLFKANKGQKELSLMSLENQKKLMNEYCRYCGNYSDYESNFGDFIPRCEKDYYKENIVTPSWNKIYNRYNGLKPNKS
jgi:uncharacterized Fe-S cluster-containing radical SAM superfamily protein